MRSAASSLATMPGDHRGQPCAQKRQDRRYPVGDGFLGRVVDALGTPIDGRVTSAPRAIALSSALAPGIVDRQPVNALYGNRPSRHRFHVPDWAAASVSLSSATARP